MSEQHAQELCTVLALWAELIEVWSLECDEEAALLGEASFAGPIPDIASWHASRMELRMRLLIELAATLNTLLVDDQRVRIWLRRRRDALGGRTPLEAMSSSVEWIEWFRRTALEFAL